MKVLVADDDPTLRMLMRELLRRNLGYEVMEAEGGPQAWQLLDSQAPPDLCIFDVLMPQMGGLDLLSKIRNDPRLRRLKVMLCSSVNERGTVLNAASLGITAYLIKPFRAEEFLDKVSRICAPPPPEPQLEVLETEELVLKRLGIGRKLYLDLLAVFLGDVDNVLGKLREFETGTSKENLPMRLVAISGAGRSLGARALLGTIPGLEGALTASDKTALHSAIDALATQKQVLAAATTALSQETEAETCIK